MSEKNNNRTKSLHLRLTAEEYAKILLNKPVTSNYRNQSLDDL